MIGDQILDYFAQFPAEPAVFIVSMLPVVELRGGIPAGIAWGLPWYTTALLAIIGNLVPAALILLFFEPVANWLQRFPVFKKFFDWLYDRTRRKFTDKYEKYGQLALVLFVAVPLPVTGAWTGSLAAWLFGIPFKKALPLLAIGVILAAVIVTLLSVGVVSLF